jgi:tetratricopeptide (TPR) repeat protein
MSRSLTPEGLIRLFSRVGSGGQAESLARDILALSPEGHDKCQHLLPLFQDGSKPVTLWDVYMAHYRHAGEVRWQQLVRSGEGVGHDAYSRLLAEPAPLRWGLVEGVCETSRQHAAKDPDQALKLAVVARDLAKIAPVRVAGKRARHELLALAWACTGNAHRNADHLKEARAALQEANQHLEVACPPLLGLTPNILSFRASLEFCERRYQDSLDTLTEALALNPEGVLRVRLLVQQGNVFVTIGGRAVEALPPLQQAVPLIDSKKEPRLWFAVLVQQLLLLTELGHFKEAEARFPEALALLGRDAAPVDALRLHWAEARIALGSDKPERAEALYRRVHEGFLEQGLAFAAALVTLELCGLLMEQGRLEEVKVHAASTLEEFHRQKVHPEFVSALALVEQAVLGQNLTLEVLAKARTLLHHS